MLLCFFVTCTFASASWFGPSSTIDGELKAQIDNISNHLQPLVCFFPQDALICCHFHIAIFTSSSQSINKETTTLLIDARDNPTLPLNQYPFQTNLFLSTLSSLSDFLFVSRSCLPTFAPTSSSLCTAFVKTFYA